jgi:hypothetical protein
MDIIVKSFDRPYYLERCLRSIYQYVQGSFQVQILDDGTPPEYLARIAELFPEVIIRTSPLYEKKVAAIRDHVQGKQSFDQRTIPTAFWMQHVAAGSDVFLLLEDDIWLNGPLLIDEIERDMTVNQLDMVKISWLGNPDVITGQKAPLSEQLEEIIPHIPFVSQVLVLDKFKVRSILKATKMMRMIRSDFKLQLPVYTLYGVASAFFTKKYWLYLWEDAQVRVDEIKQLQKAGKWYEQQHGRYAKSKRELTKTSFSTSATNMYRGVELDIFVFNHHLNEAWKKGKLDAMENFPQDFSQSYIREQLAAANDPRASFDEWKKWIQKFQAQYLSFGCEVE